VIKKMNEYGRQFIIMFFKNFINSLLMMV